MGEVKWINSNAYKMIILIALVVVPPDNGVVKDFIAAIGKKFKE